MKLSRTKPDIVLLSPPSRSFNHYRPPMALIFLAGYLDHMGLKSHIIDITENTVIRNKKFFSDINHHLADIKERIINEVILHPSPVYGITCYTPEYFEVLELARQIKTIHPHSKIVVGGIHPTLYPDELLLEPNSPVDFEVIGEGEETLYELVKAIKSHRYKFSHIKGLAYLNKKNKTIIKTPLRPVQNNLDRISYPAYDKIDMEYYTTASPYSLRGCFLRSAYLLATRGCPSTCTFCVAKKLRSFNGGGRYTRVRSASRLISEIKHLRKEYGIDSFYFIDDLFTINQKNVATFCKLLKKNHLELLWGCSSKVSTLNENLLKLMAEAGCIQIDFGVERGSNQALLDIQKGISTQMVENIFKLCHQYHIRTFANFLVNLPGETIQDLNDILQFSQKLKPDIVSINVFTPYPGTEIYDQSKYHFSKNEYPLLVNASELIQSQPRKFRFSCHKIDILHWANLANKKLNPFLPTLKFHLSYRYFKTIFSSPRKGNYLARFHFLIQEFINQKFSL